MKDNYKYSKLKHIIKSDGSLKDFINEIWNEYHNLSAIEKQLNDPEWLNWNYLLFDIVIKNRVDIFEYIWNVGFRFNIFRKQDYLGFQSIYDLCIECNKKEILELINRKTGNIKLFTEVWRIQYNKAFDNKTILSCSASDLKDYIRVKNFHQSNRDKLLKFCDDNNIMYATLKYNNLDEYNFYGRFIESKKRDANRLHQVMKEMSNRSVGTDFEFNYDKTTQEQEKEYIRRHIEWYNTLNFVNAPILSKHSVLIVKKDFKIESLERIQQQLLQITL